MNAKTGKSETQILVRRSANGTSKWGVGTGVPATRWMLSTEAGSPPFGYKYSEPRLRFEASNFPEFPKAPGQDTWSYDKIDIREDAFTAPGATAFNDPQLEEYARNVRKALQTRLSGQMDGGSTTVDPWEADTISVVRRIVDQPNSVAAIQGTLRMSGLFAKNAPVDPATLAASCRIFTMFPQMPDPMPLPSTSPEALKQEIASRQERMAASGRDPHGDAHGRRFTHISTSNVSNTIHGVYLICDLSGLPGYDEVPAYDLFGTTEIQREWVSLQDLKVLDSDGEAIGTEDTKPTFISGFIVRQLVKDGVIDLGIPATP